MLCFRSLGHKGTRVIRPPSLLREVHPKETRSTCLDLDGWKRRKRRLLAVIRIMKFLPDPLRVVGSVIEWPPPLLRVVFWGAFLPLLIMFLPAGKESSNMDKSDTQICLLLHEVGESFSKHVWLMPVWGVTCYFPNLPAKCTVEVWMQTCPPAILSIKLSGKAIRKRENYWRFWQQTWCSPGSFQIGGNSLESFLWTLSRHERSILMGFAWTDSRDESYTLLHNISNLKEDVEFCPRLVPNAKS